MFIKKEGEFEDGINYLGRNADGSEYAYRKGSYNLTDYINISNADSISYLKYKNENNGSLTIYFSGKSIRIEDVSTAEWSKIQESLHNENKGIFDLSKFRKDSKGVLDNRSNQLNPNNDEYKR